ncbi:hypothetical protein [Saccharopolyspora shandongensis]|uniref:hypothetical protein n=1 Tax=Saccharopolyspora shandongensis TaxID=418495 RepID=UPI0033F0B8D7
MRSEIIELFDTELPSDAPERSAYRTYLMQFSWTVSMREGDQIFAELDDEFGGLQLPTQLAIQVIAALRARQLECPAIVRTGSGQGNCVLLFRPAGMANAAMFPSMVALLRAGDQVMLPTGGPRSRVEWLSPLQSGDPNVALPTAWTLARVIADLLRTRSGQTPVLTAAA